MFLSLFFRIVIRKIKIYFYSNTLTLERTINSVQWFPYRKIVGKFFFKLIWKYCTFDINCMFISNSSRGVRDRVIRITAFETLGTKDCGFESRRGL